MEKPDLQQFPDTPGVYLYKNAEGIIIYVGKARRLRRRIASYFRPANTLSAKTRIMLGHAVSLDILNTATEKEALLLETSLIKKHKPRYNILLKDDKNSLLFRIVHNHPYPRIEIIRHTSKRRKKDGETFGPFSSGLAARETWKLLHKYFGLRRCHNRAFNNRTRPCLYHDMGQCLAPCVKNIPKEQYAQLLDKARLLLTGRSRQLSEELKTDMLAASNALHFEVAARLRDQIKAIQQTVERQSVVLQAGTDIDLIGVAQIPEGLALGIVFVRDGLLLEGNTFFWPALDVEDTPELLYSFISQFYLADAAPIPQAIVVPWLPKHEADQTGNCTDADDATVDWQESFSQLQQILTEQREKVTFIRKPKSTDEDRLVLLAATNAKEARSNKQQPALADKLARLLHSAKPIERIEMVDISHTSGKQTKAGMVVFYQQEPCPHDYRHYNLDASMHEAKIKAGDDYAALSIFAQRRVNSGPPWPDLLLIDGGKGQLAAVGQALSEAFSLLPTPANDAKTTGITPLAEKTPPEEALPEKTQCSTTQQTTVPFAGNGTPHFYEPTSLDAGATSADEPHLSFHPGSDATSRCSDFGLDSSPGCNSSSNYNSSLDTGSDFGSDSLSGTKAGSDTARLVQSLIHSTQQNPAHIESNIPFLLASIAKARTEEGHTDRRAGNINDRIFIPNRNNPLNLTPGSQELLYLQHIRDTAHNYVIGKHRKARSAATLAGELTRIPGIGPKLAQTLFQHFGSLATMAQAEPEALWRIPGIGKAKASMLRQRLQLLVKK